MGIDHHLQCGDPIMGVRDSITEDSIMVAHTTVDIIAGDKFFNNG